MNAEEIKALIAGLATSNGYYSRLYDKLTDEHYDELASYNFADPIDVIMYIES